MTYALRNGQPDRSSEPTLDDYFTAAEALGAVVRRAFDDRHSVRRLELQQALEEFERVNELSRAWPR